MKRQAALVVLLYFLAIIALTWPVTLAAFWPQMKLSDVADGFQHSMYWSWVIVIVLGQAALLALPVKVARGRPVSRRTLLWPIVASGLMIGGLVFGAGAALFEFVQRDKVADSASWWALAAGAVTWIAWSVAFHRMSANSSPADVVARQSRLLLRGSLLELLIAVPTHIVARSRGYCCAGFSTFIGIAFGLAVMLMSFGPAVFFLFVDRWKRLHPEATA